MRALAEIAGLDELVQSEAGDAASMLANTVRAGGVVYVAQDDQGAAVVAALSPLLPGVSRKTFAFEVRKTAAREEAVEMLNRVIGDQFELEQDAGGLVKIEATQAIVDNTAIRLDEIGFRVVGYKEYDLWMGGQLVDTLVGEVVNPMLWANRKSEEPGPEDDISEEVEVGLEQEAQRPAPDMVPDVEVNAGCL